jgi:hypothetical protein
VLVGVFGSVFIFPLTVALWRFAQILWAGRLPESEYPAFLQRYADLGAALQRGQAPSQTSAAADIPAPHRERTTPEAVPVPHLDRPASSTPAPEVEWAPLVAADGTPLPNAPESESVEDSSEMVQIPREILEQIEAHMSRLSVLESPGVDAIGEAGAAQTARVSVASKPSASGTDDGGHRPRFGITIGGFRVERHGTEINVALWRVVPSEPD